MFIYPIYYHNWRNISTIYILLYITRIASKEIFLTSNKTHREVGRAKDLSAPRYYCASSTNSIKGVCDLFGYEQNNQITKDFGVAGE